MARVDEDAAFDGDDGDGDGSGESTYGHAQDLLLLGDRHGDGWRMLFRWKETEKDGGEIWG